MGSSDHPRVYALRDIVRVEVDYNKEPGGGAGRDGGAGRNVGVGLTAAGGTILAAAFVGTVYAASQCHPCSGEFAGFVFIPVIIGVLGGGLGLGLLIPGIVILNSDPPKAHVVESAPRLELAPGGVRVSF